MKFGNFHKYFLNQKDGFSIIIHFYILYNSISNVQYIYETDVEINDDNFMMYCTKCG